MSEKEALPVADKNEIIVYQPEGGEFHIEVRVENETVWLTQAQMAELFSKSISVISRHIANVFAEHELEEKSNLHFLQIANSDHVGASFKDLGNQMTAFSVLNFVTKEQVLAMVK